MRAAELFNQCTAFATCPGGCEAMAAAAAADYDGVRTGRIEGDFGGGRTEFRFYEKKGLITVKVGGDGRVPAIKRRSRKKRFCEDTLTAIRRKLPEY